MRERITIIHHPGAGIDPALLDIKATKLQGPAMEAVKEHKLMLSLDDLTAEIASLLQDTRELHLRWTSPFSYDTLEPFSSRLSPGLHVSYSPLKKDAHDLSKLCSLLQAFGQLDCHSPEAFTNFSKGRYAESPDLYFYQEVDSLDIFIKQAESTIFAASDSTSKKRLQDLKTAASLDISYESSSKSLKIGAFWPLHTFDVSVPSSSSERTEVGILGRDIPPAIEPHEFGVSGVLAVLGDNKEPSNTIFAFPARHRASEGSFSSKFLAPTGLHPTLQLDLDARESPIEDGECTLHAYLTLPRTIFADRYQLAGELFLASKNLSAAPYVSEPVDLEAPEYTTKTWGSNVLLTLTPPNQATSARWTAEVPLHLRYLRPSATGKTDIEVPYPAVFWACDFDGVDFKSPFDRTYLGYDGLFSPTTSFWHLTPKTDSSSRLLNRITVPVVTEHASQWTGVGTAAVVGLGFVWVLWNLVKALAASGYGRSAAAANVQDDKKQN